MIFILPAWAGGRLHYFQDSKKEERPADFFPGAEQFFTGLAEVGVPRWIMV
jgi:hypothetical protein